MMKVFLSVVLVLLFSVACDSEEKLQSKVDEALDNSNAEGKEVKSPSKLDGAMEIAKADGEEVKWQTKMDVALKLAKAEGKDVFAFFTGSDWCNYCVVLHRKVFDKGDFLNNLEKKYVLLKIDFPQRKPLPKAEREINDKLSQDYSIEGFPTVLLLDTEGRAFAKTGFRDEGPDEYAKHLDTLAENKQKRDVALAKAAKLSGLDKAKALIEALNSIGGVPITQYKNIQDEIVKADPEDKTGYKKNTLIKQGLADLEMKIIRLIEFNKTSEAIKAIDDFIAEHKPAAEVKQKIMLYKVYTYTKDSTNLDKVDKLMDEIIAIDPNTEAAESARGIKKQVAEMRRTEEKK